MNAVMAGTHPHTVAWCGQEAVRAAVQAELATALERTIDLQWAGGFHRQIGLGEPTAYLHRVINLPSGPALAGVRFLGGNRERPFVELLACPAADVAEAARAALRAYAVFAPGMVRVHTSGQPPAMHATGPGPGWSIRADQFTFAAPVGQMTGAAEATARGLTLHDASLEEAVAFVAEQYVLFNARRPDLADRVPAATPEALAQCVNHGHAVWWHVHGQRVGLLAVRPETLRGLRGLLIEEEIVDHDSTIRGTIRGTARHAQALLAARIAERSPGTLLIGCIDGLNTPSLHTAGRTGRGVVAATWFCTAADSSTAADFSTAAGPV